ncbi:MAG: hypothetical protein ACREJD_17810 [Phycisphaerales bacterium]
MPIVWIVRFLLVAACAGILAFVLSSGIPKGQAKLYIGAPVIILAFVWAASESFFDRRRISSLRTRLEFLGFLPRASESLHYEREEGHRDLSLEINLLADWQGVPIRITEFNFQQGSGKSTVKHRFLQAAAAVTDIPEFQLAPAGFLATQNLADVKVLPARDKSLESRFTRRWNVVWPHSDDAAEHFPEPLLQWLTDAPRYETWRCADGELSCTWKRGCTPDQAEQLLGRLATFLRLYRA